jgi:ligand-binding sensor domain-containing protein/serine phosphatase RsbU (regulator of sigma subunit)
MRIFLILLMMLGGGRLWAQQGTTQKPFFDPQLQITQYIVQNWTTDKQLPSSNISKLLHSRRGYLWLAGFDGLVQFDGVQFKTYNKKNLPFLRNNVITALHEGKSQVWVTSQSSGLLAVEEGGAMKHYGLEKLPLSALYEAPDGMLWLGTRQQGLYWYWPAQDSLRPIAYPNFDGVGIYNIYADKSGKIWLPTDGNGLVCYYKKQWRTYQKAEGLPTNSVLSVFEDSQARIWAATTNGLCLLQGERFVPVENFEGKIVHRVVEDPAGNIWVGSSSGLYRLNVLSRRWERHHYEQQNAINNITDLCLDPEGSLWIATYRSGLFRLKEGKFINYTQEDGLSSMAIGSIAEVRPQEYWVGSNNGQINILKDGKIESYRLKNQVSEVRIFNIFKDSRERVWICTFNGLVCIAPDGSERLYTTKEGLADNAVRVTKEDLQGNIWVGTRWGGISKISPEGKIEVLNTRTGLASNFIMSLQCDKEGNMWVGTNDGGLNIISPEGKIQTIGIAEGLESNLIFNTYQDAQGLVWVVSNGGIARIEKGNITNYSSEQGLPNDSPFDFIEDRQGNVWLPTSKGVVMVKKKALNDYALQRVAHIEWHLYDKDDGLKSDDCTGAAHSLLAADGSVWIPTNGALIRINPNAIPLNLMRPPVDIHSFLADGKPVAGRRNIQIASEVRRLSFAYSGLSLLAPAKVKFKYKLEGFDKDWVEAGTERQAVYTNLPAGKYTFRVLASNNDGLWNEEGDAIAFEIVPAFYETLWFYFSIPLLFFALVVGFYSWRIGNIKKQNAALDALVQLRSAEIIEKNRSILASIEYAKRIQEATLPQLDTLHKYLPQSFVLFKPKDIVSGDFYWFAESGDKLIIAVADCTGHGVPGAFMALIGNNLLNEIVNIKGIVHTSAILQHLHQGIIQALHQPESKRNDGMEIAVCCIHKRRRWIEYAGARIPLVYIQNGRLFEVAADGFSIGGLWHNSERVAFHHHIIPLHEDTHFYLLTDGYKDQFGGTSGKKFMRKRMNELLLKIHQESAEKQQALLQEALQHWMGTQVQVDDILVMGFQMNKDLTIEPTASKSLLQSL